MSLYAIFPPMGPKSGCSSSFQSTGDCISQDDRVTVSQSLPIDSKPAMSRPPSSAAASKFPSFAERLFRGSSPYFIMESATSRKSKASSCDEPLKSINVGGSDVGIQVKHAHIDARHLIRSLTVVSNKDRKDEIHFPHQDAVTFELFVSCNGRKYTACRTMRSILRLRCDLVDEEHKLRQKIAERRRIAFARAAKHNDPADDLVDDVTDVTDDSCVSEWDVIPEVPKLSDDPVGVRGFTQLDAVLRSYKPVLNRWMREMIEVVPDDSAVLSQFLWEPLRQSSTGCAKASSRRNSSGSALGSIGEDDCDDSDCESP